jgi:hypothetical protein
VEREKAEERDKVGGKRNGLHHRNLDQEENDKGDVRMSNDIAVKDGFVCVICVLRSKSRSTLTGHYEKHRQAGLFKQARQCSACRSDGKTIWVEKGYLMRLNHLERFQGECYTPYFQQTERYTGEYPCPFAPYGVQRENEMYNSRGLTGHFVRSHNSEQDPDVKANSEARYNAKDALTTPKVPFAADHKHLGLEASYRPSPLWVTSRDIPMLPVSGHGSHCHRSEITLLQPTRTKGELLRQSVPMPRVHQSRTSRNSEHHRKKGMAGT